MNSFRFILEKYRGRHSRYECPSCGKANELTRYIDTTIGQHLHHAVGKCNRESKCGFHYPPWEYFAENNITPEPALCAAGLRLEYQTEPPKPPSTIDKEVMWKSIQSNAPNHFVQYLYLLFGAEKTQQLVSKYRIGTAYKWRGATVFWQVDINGNVRGGKVMLYDSLSGKRDKECFSWAHSCMKLENFNLEQCLFGEHLLRENPSKQVALVESEKTATIASQFLPQYIWLATGGKSGLSDRKLQVLKGRKVTVFPDLDAHEKWREQFKQFSYIADFTVSDVLTKIATNEEYKEGLDPADFLIREDAQDFIQAYLK